MNLPNDIVADFRSHSSEPDPTVAIRAMGDVLGNIGESYVLCDGTILFIYSKQLGGDLQKIRLKLADVSAMKKTIDRPYLNLRIPQDPDDYALKFSTFEEPKVDQILDAWKTCAPEAAAALAESAEPEPAEPDPVAEAEPEAVSPENVIPPSPTVAEDVTSVIVVDDAALLDISPMVGFCAAMHAIVHADMYVAPEETEDMNRLFDEDTIAEGMQYWQEIGTDALVCQLKELLTKKQKLCLMANLIDTAMVDGVYRTIENQTVRWFRDQLGVDSDNFRAIHEVLVIKNQIGVFLDDD
jgi:uncharacterized tellurite resistance protein B-like protein